MSKSAFLEAVSVSRETERRLDTFAELLTKWNRHINLVSASTLKDLWSRHFLDSAQLLSLAEGRSGLWLDVGTGGGFPGIVVAIIAAEAQPDLRVRCIESDQRKATFLRTVARECGVSVEVLSERVERVEPAGADVISARALAPLDDLLAYAQRHLKPGGLALFLKGAGYREELETALVNWRFQVDTYPSKTNPDAVVLKIGDIERA